MSETSTPEAATLLPWLPGVGPQDLPATLLVEPEPGEPVEVSGTDARGWVPRPEGDVESSWLRQITVLRSGQQLLRLQASLDEPAFAGVRGDQRQELPAIQWPLSHSRVGCIALATFPPCPWPLTALPLAWE